MRMNKNETYEYSEVISKPKRKKGLPVIFSIVFIGAIITSIILTNESSKRINDWGTNEKTVLASTTTPTATTKPTATSKPTTPTPTPIGTKVNVSVDYTTNIVKITQGSGSSTKFYISSDKKKTWELINEDATATNCTLSLSGYLKSSGVTLYFRGNNDIEPVALVIPKETTNIKITYQSKALVFENFTPTTTAILEYRVSENTDWADYTSRTSINFTDYERTGITLEFRVKATTTVPAGKIISVKIPKRTKGPSVKADLSKMVITGLKSGSTQYRVGNSTKWETFQPTDTKVKVLSLYDLLSNAVKNSPFPVSTIDFRTAATDKKPASAVISLQILAQPVAPTNFKVASSTLTISDASKTKPYEYTVLKSGTTIDLTKVSWKKVTNTNSIVIKKTGSAATVAGDVIYVRTASVTDKTTKVTTPASAYATFVITSVSAN